MRKLLVVAVVHFLFISGSMALADTVFYTSETEWLAAVSGDVEYFPTTAENIAKADEVPTPPVNGEALGPVLTFQSANTGLSRGFDIRALQSGADWIYIDDTGHTPAPGLGVGRNDTHEDDDWEINMLDGPNLMGFAFELVGNHFYDPALSEAFEVYSPDGTLLGRMDETTAPAIPMTAENDSQFLGVVATEPIGRAFFDEDSGGDDVIIANLRVVPEPTTLSLLVLGGLAVMRPRRVA